VRGCRFFPDSLFFRNPDVRTPSVGKMCKWSARRKIDVALPDALFHNRLRDPKETTARRAGTAMGKLTLD
jgi:hypothetical protein